MSFYYNINADTFISLEVMKRTRRIATYADRYLEDNLPYRQVYIERYCSEKCIEEPVYGLIHIPFEPGKYTEDEYKEFIKQYIKEHGYVWDHRRIEEGVPDESAYYESLYHKYETNNWLKAHHMPMRRTVPKKYRSHKIYEKPSYCVMPVGASGTGKTAQFILPNIYEGQNNIKPINPYAHDELSALMLHAEGGKNYVEQMKKLARKHEKQTFPPIGEEKLLPSTTPDSINAKRKEVK